MIDDHMKLIFEKKRKRKKGKRKKGKLLPKN
jgi:hypothetical protein